MCCGGMCMCGMSPLNNSYRGDVIAGRESCQCEPEEEVCIDPSVSYMALTISHICLSETPIIRTHKNVHIIALIEYPNF